MKLIAFDIETAGTVPAYALQPWRLKTGEAWITTYSVCYIKDGEYKFQGKIKPTVENFGDIFIRAHRRDFTICGWNLTFDLAWMYALGLDEFINKCNFLDGMQLWKHATREPEYDTDRTKKKSYSLKEYVRQYHPEDANYEDGIDYQDQSDEGLNKLLKYNHIDTKYTLIGTYHWWEALTEIQQNCATIEAATIPLIAKANLDGMVIDVEAAHNLGKKLDQVQIDMEDKLHEWDVTPEIIRSPTKLAGLLFDQWSLPVFKENTGKKTGKISRATDKETLHELSFIDERVKYIRTYRETLGNRKKFVETILDSVNYNQNGKTHPQAIINSTYTSRMTYSSAQGKGINKVQTGFALHQEKASPEFRDLVVAPEGYQIVEVDAANQEYRWMAIMSGDETMLSLCQDGEDAHSYMVAKISEYSYEEMCKNKEEQPYKKIRKAGKVVNLSCIAEGTLVLTDRGVCCIEDVQLSDRIWDGLEFVNHSGIVYQGEKDTIVYQGLRATLDHKVLTDYGWQDFYNAARYGWRIKSSMVEEQSYKRLERKSILTYMFSQICSIWNDWRRNFRTSLESSVRKAKRLERTKKKVRVYDILNCGPRNQFVANGLIVHNCQYRTSANKVRYISRIQYDMDMTPDEAKRNWAIYRQTYKKVPEYWSQQIFRTKQLGYVENIAGRRVYIEGDWTGQQKWAMESTAINFPIQSIGAEQKYLALKSLKSYLLQNYCYFAWDLHDGLYFYVPNDFVNAFCRTVKYGLKQLPYKAAWGFKPPIPMLWDVKYGPSWGQLREFEE